MNAEPRILLFRKSPTRGKHSSPKTTPTTPKPNSVPLANKLQIIAITNPFLLHKIEEHVNELVLEDERLTNACLESLR